FAFAGGAWSATWTLDRRSLHFQIKSSHSLGCGSCLVCGCWRSGSFGWRPVVAVGSVCLHVLTSASCFHKVGKISRSILPRCAHIIVGVLMLPIEARREEQATVSG